jgi:hypothetical protein
MDLDMMVRATSKTWVVVGSFVRLYRGDNDEPVVLPVQDR